MQRRTLKRLARLIKQVSLIPHRPAKLSNRSIHKYPLIVLALRERCLDIVRLSFKLILLAPMHEGLKFNFLTVFTDCWHISTFSCIARLKTAFQGALKFLLRQSWKDVARYFDFRTFISKQSSNVAEKLWQRLCVWWVSISPEKIRKPSVFWRF